MDNLNYKDALNAATKSSTILSLSTGNASPNNSNQQQQLISNVKLLNTNLSDMSLSLKRIVGIFENALFVKNKERYLREEQAMEQKDSLASLRIPKAESEPGQLGSLLKSFFTNPAVITAFSGLAYLLLPKDVKEKINAFFKGFASGIDGLDNATKELKTALGIAAVGLGTYFGVKLLGNIASALATTLSLIAIAAKPVKNLFKNKPGTGGKPGKTLRGPAVGAAAVGAVGIAGAAGAAASTVDFSKLKEILPELPDDVAEILSQAYPSMTGGDKTYSESTGLKQEGSTGFKVPAGDDGTKAFIKENEGLSYTPYKDSLGLWHIGYGHLIGNGKTLPKEFNRRFTQEEVDALFEKDYARHRKAAEKIPNFNKLNDSGKTALTDLTYNMGPNWYKKWPRFTAAMEKGDIAGAIASLENSKWYGQVGGRAPKVISLLRSNILELSDSPVKVESQEAAAPIAAPVAEAVQKPGIEVKPFGFGGAEGLPLSPTKPDLTVAPFGSTTMLGGSKPNESAMPFGSTMMLGAGKKLMEASEQVEAMPFGNQDTTIINNYDNSKQISSKPNVAPPPIPGPSFDRGSLNERTKHQTAY